MHKSSLSNTDIENISFDEILENRIGMGKY
jgi:hypothetical protein